MESFKASVQYGDWEGTAAADDAHKDLREYLEGKNLINPDEFILAASLYVDEGFTNVRVFAFKGGNSFELVKDPLAAISGPIPVREVDVKLTREQFFVLFKRLDVILTKKGLELEGREFSVIEN
jgi:hypothetical protein